MTTAIVIFTIVMGVTLRKKQGFENLRAEQIGGISAGAILALVLLIFGIYIFLRYQTGQILRKYGL